MDKRYLDYVAMVDLIQNCGRGVRSEDDFCRTWIVDDNFWDWFYKKNRKMMPKWFLAAIRRVSSIHDIN